MAITVMEMTAIGVTTTGMTASVVFGLTIWFFCRASGPEA
jgi:hypothetical protein